MTCISNLVPHQFRGPAQVGLGVCLVTAVAVSLIGALGLAQIPLLNTLSQSACIALCASGGGFSLLLGIALASLISSRKALLTNLQETVRTAPHQSSPANASHESNPPNPPNRQEVERSAPHQSYPANTSHESDSPNPEVEERLPPPENTDDHAPPPPKKKSAQKGKSTSSSEEASVDLDPPREGSDVTPFGEVFSNTWLQQYFFEKGFLSLSDMIRLSASYKFIREPFKAFPYWRVKILQRLIYNKALLMLKKVRASENNFSRNDKLFYKSYLKIASAQAKNDLEGALRTAKSIKNTEKQAEALCNIATEQAKSDVKGALQTAESITSAEKRAEALCNIATEQAKNDVVGALQTAESITNFKKRAEALCNIATEQAKNDVEGALQTARSITSAEKRPEALCNIATEQAKNDVGGALKTAKSITPAEIQAEAICNVATEQAKNDVGGALQTAESITCVLIKSDAFTNIAAELVKEKGWATNPQGIAAFRLSQKDLDVQKLFDELKNNELVKLDTKDINKALEIANSIEDSGGYALAIYEIAAIQAKSDVDLAFKVLELVKRSRDSEPSFFIKGPIGVLYDKVFCYIVTELAKKMRKEH